MTMQHYSGYLLLLGLLMTSLPAHAQDDKAQILATINRVVAAAGHLDLKGIEAEIAPQSTVIDDLAPNYWSGPDAFAQWETVVAAQWRAMGVTQAKMSVQESPFTEIKGDLAYAPEPAHFSIRGGNRSLDSDGTLTFALIKIDGHWKIRSMTWAATK